MSEGKSQKGQKEVNCFEKDSTKTINMTGEDLSGVEQQSGKDSSSSSFYETSGQKWGFSNNSKQFFKRNQQENMMGQYRDLNSDYQQSHGNNQHQNNMPKVINSTTPNTPYSNT